MATSGSTTLSNFPGTGWTTVVSWSFSSSSIPNNTQTFAVTCQLSSAAGVAAINSGTMYFLGANVPSTVFNPTSRSVGAVSAGSSKSVTSNVTITGTNATGAAAGFATYIQVRFIGEMRGNSVDTTSSSISISPNALDRKSNPTVPSSITLGTNFTVTTNRASSNFTHTIQLKAGTQGFTNIATGVGASKTDCNAATATWANYITNAASVTGTIRVYTYESGTSLGYVDKALTVNVPSSCVPVMGAISFSDEAAVDYYTQFGGFLSSVSKLRLHWTETISYGSAIATRTATFAGQSVSLSELDGTGATVNISNFGSVSGTITATIKDGRNRIASQTTSTIKIYEYHAPVVGNSHIYRSDENGDSRPDGTYISMVIPWTKSSLKDANDVEQNYIGISVKVNNTVVATYGTSNTDAPNNTLLILPGTYSDTINYPIEVAVYDSTGNASYYRTTIVPSSRPFSFRAYVNGTTGVKTWGFAIGKVSEVPDVMEIGVVTHVLKNFRIQSSNVDILNPPASGTNWGNARLYFTDKNNVAFGYAEPFHINNDRIGVELMSCRVVGTTTYHNGVQFTIGDDGTRYVNVSAPEAWRTAIGAVNIAGDTMTGALVIKSAHMYSMSTTYTNNVTPSTSGWANGHVFYDKNGTDVGRVAPYYSSAGTQGVYIRARRYIGSTEYINQVGLLIDGSGNQSVSFATGGAAAWRSAIGAVYTGGDTMTNTLDFSGVRVPTTYKFTNVEERIGQTAPSSYEYFDPMWCTGKNGKLIYYMEGARSTSNVLSLTAGLRRHAASGSTTYTNYFTLNLDNSGTGTVSFSHPAAWRSGLGAAASSHTHAAGDITSGTLSADRIPNLNTSKLTAGTLGIARGGTGTTTGIKGWTSLGNSTGTTAITLSLSGYTEIYVNGAYSTSYRSGLVIPTAFIGSTEYEWYLGGGNKGGSSTSGRRGVFKLTSTKMTPVLMTIDGTDKTDSNCKWWVYAR